MCCWNKDSVKARVCLHGILHLSRHDSLTAKLSADMTISGWEQSAPPPLGAGGSALGNTGVFLDGRISYSPGKWMDLGLQYWVAPLWHASGSSVCCLGGRLLLSCVPLALVPTLLHALQGAKAVLNCRRTSGVWGPVSTRHKGIFPFFYLLQQSLVQLTWAASLKVSCSTRY
jgi:hypothetical protein